MLISFTFYYLIACQYDSASKCTTTTLNKYRYEKCTFCFVGLQIFTKVIYRIFFKEDIFHKIISLMQKKAGYKYQLSRGMTHVNKSRQPRKSKIWLTISSLSLLAICCNFKFVLHCANHTTLIRPQFYILSIAK